MKSLGALCLEFDHVPAVANAFAPWLRQLASCRLVI
jgi:hypothetical protein